MSFPAAPYQRQKCQNLSSEAEVAASWSEILSGKPATSNKNPTPLERSLHHHRGAADIVAGIEDHVDFGGDLGTGLVEGEGGVEGEGAPGAGACR